MKHMSFVNVSTVAESVPERLLLRGWLALPLRWLYFSRFVRFAPSVSFWAFPIAERFPQDVKL
jgi:hypothetical protein